jgi:hypothetical protein
VLSTTITLGLEGEIPFARFAEAIRHWQALVDSLSDQVGRDADIEWIIDNLAVGSAVATIRGESSDIEAVDRVVHAYETVGRSLEQGQVIPFAPKVAREARNITKVLNGKITAVRFETANEESVIVSGMSREKPRVVRSFGAIEGRIQTLSSRQALRFTLYDSVHDRAVNCYLQEGRESLMRDAWDRRAIVEGRVSRDEATGRPTAIRQIENVIILDDVPAGWYRQARGVAPVAPDDLLPEDAIRLLRDA